MSIQPVLHNGFAENQHASRIVNAYVEKSFDRLEEEVSRGLRASRTYRTAIGHLIGKNYVEASKEFRIAANQGSVPALAALGKLCLLGLGVTQNEAKGVKLLRQATYLGDVKAPYLLSRHLVAKGNAEEGLRLLNLAADRGCIPARATLCEHILVNMAKKKAASLTLR